MNNKYLHPRLRRTIQLSGKSHLCCQTVMITVINVT